MLIVDVGIMDTGHANGHGVEEWAYHRHGIRVKGRRHATINGVSSKQ